MAKYKIGDVAVTAYGLGVITSIETRMNRVYQTGTQLYEHKQELYYGLNNASGGGAQGLGGNSMFVSIRESDIKRVL
jgi:hypothetical protein